MPHAMHAFRARPADIQAMQPGLISGGQLAFFGFQGTVTALQATVDAWLNVEQAEATVTYRVASPTALVSFMKAQRLTSTAGPAGGGGGQRPQTDPAYGWVLDGECALWVLLAGGKLVGETFVPDRLVWWMPYVWVDTAVAMATGREVWGFYKDLGTITAPATSAGPFACGLETMIYPTLGPDVQGVTQTLLSVNAAPTTLLGRIEHAIEDVVMGLEDANALFRGALSSDGIAPEIASLVTFAKSLMHFQIPVTNLKQFRAPDHGAFACFQATVETACTITTLHAAGRIPGDWGLVITPCESHPLASLLGLSGDTVPVTFAGWVNMDFTAGEGATLWQNVQPFTAS